MKLILAVVQQHKADEVLRALAAVEGLPGVIISRIRGFGKGRDRFDVHKIHEGSFLYVERTKLEVVCRDEQVEAALEAIRRAAYTGATGDGKVFVLPVEDCLKIRTGERGEAAI